MIVAKYRVLIFCYLLSMCYFNECTAFPIKKMEFTAEVYNDQVSSIEPVFLSFIISNKSRRTRLIRNPSSTVTTTIQFREKGSEEWISTAPFTVEDGSQIESHVLDTYNLSVNGKSTVEFSFAIMPCSLSDGYINGKTYDVRLLYSYKKGEEPLIVNAGIFQVNDENNSIANSYLKNIKYPCFLYEPNLYMRSETASFSVKTHLSYLEKNNSNMEYNQWVKLYNLELNMIQRIEIDQNSLEDLLSTKNPFIREKVKYLLSELKYY